MPFCDACGAGNRAGALFCGACGRRLPGPDPGFESEPTAGLESAPTAARPAPSGGFAEPEVPPGLVRALAGTYEVRRLLGRGGMGAVYLAREVALDRLVALKVILDDRVDRTGVERFLAEARLAARLRHPNIVGIHAVGRQAGVNFFTMDYVEGTTLGSLVEREGGNGLPPAEARRIVLDICLAVGHAHRMGVLHRDLKPGNVMVDRGGHVLVMDFGLAKAMDASALTAPDVILGTPAYVSPEQLQGQPASPRSDLYAVGLIFYFVLTGRRLVAGDSMTAVVAQHVSGAPASRLLADSTVPADLKGILASMVQKDPERRPASLDEVVARLRVRPPADLPTTPDEVVPPPREAPGPGSGKRSPSSDAARRLSRERMKGLLDKLGKKERP